MSELEFPDPESIPLPDDIPVPDDIPLPPDDDPTERVDPKAEPLESTINKRRAPDDEIQQSNHDRNKISQQNKRARREEARIRHLDIYPPTSTDNLKKEQELIARLMGFSNFDTTKGKMVPGNQSVGAVHVVKKRRYRQYMNRKGGFNRPLDKVP